MLYPEPDRLATAGGFGFQIAREGYVEDGMWAKGERK